MSASAVVFCGPTITPAEAAEHTTAQCRPPVAMGDVYRAQLQGARIIAIIDGYFERVPAVWHKEILWALSHGVHVLGASSMGALRAAELAAFGMVGVGSIFEGYRSGELRRDDEVAVAHAPVEDGLAPLSIALVNMRATLATAVTRGVLPAPVADRLVTLAEQTFYPQRTWEHLVQRARREGLDSEILDDLARWLPTNTVDLKRRDAVELLTTVEQWRRDGIAPKQVTYSFEHTSYWDNAMRECTLAAANDATRSGHPTTPDPTTHDHHTPDQATPDHEAPGRPDGSTPARVIDETKLHPERYRELREQALLRAVAIEVGAAKGYRPTPEDLQEASEQFRRTTGLLSADALAAWLRERHLDPDDWPRMVRELAYERWVRRAAEASLEHRLVDHLRLGDEYPRLAARAHDKSRRLRAAGLDDVAAAGGPVATDEVTTWWFEQVLGTTVPSDLPGYVERHGLELADFLRALRREYWYRRLTEHDAASPGGVDPD